MSCHAQLLYKALDSVSMRSSMEDSALIFFQQGVGLCVPGLPWNAQVSRGGNRFPFWKWLLEVLSNFQSIFSGLGKLLVRSRPLVLLYKDS